MLWREMPPTTRRSVLHRLPWVGYYPIRVYLRAGDALLFYWWFHVWAPLMFRLELAAGVNSAELLARRHTVDD
jgi:hypothetical protein